MFPQKFLTRMAQTHQLSADQERVFLLRFEGDREDRDVSSLLEISEEAYRKRMGEIYRKFEISGKGPGKNNRLLHILQNYLEAETNSQINSQINSQSIQNLAIANEFVSDLGNSVNNATTNNSNGDIEELVRQLRDRSQQVIQERCATMRVLDMSHPMRLEDIYTGTDVLEKISSRRRLGIGDLLATYHSSDHPDMGSVNEQRVSGIDALNRVSKLMLLGKPGAGKTTLLKYTALKCSQGEIFSQLVPIFLTLRQYASSETSLLNYIIQDFRVCNIADASSIHQVLQCGRAILFLDGLDEVREDDLYRILEDLRSFSGQYYHNRFVITSRLGAQEYVFEKFTEVEVANFQPLHISRFAQRWFADHPRYIELFLRKVEDNKPIQELATNPLLLTLLCLVFDEYGDFPANRSELYREGLDVLLKKWDVKRNIERHQLYKNLSMQRKEDLLSQVACETFKRGDYFFRQIDLENYITEYIRNLPRANNSEDALQLDSVAIIKAIESQHGLFVERARGIYSFSHLTFQEYLAAREFVYNGNLETLNLLAAKITDHRWQDILRLAVGMMRSADELLTSMKEQCDRLLAGDRQLQSLLQWVTQKAESAQVRDRLQSVRAFYLTLGRAIAQSDPLNLANVLARTLVLDLDLCQNRNLNVDLAFDLARALETKEGEDLGLDLELDLSLALEYAQEMSDPRLADALTELINTCPEDDDSDIKWQHWANNLRKQTIAHRNIGQIWDFTPHQLQQLSSYCKANRLLVECLNSDCYVHQTVRQAIEQSLLLPNA